MPETKPTPVRLVPLPLVLSLVLVLMACGEHATQVDVDGAASASVSHRVGTLLGADLDQRLATLGQVIPGFAGILRGPNRSIVVRTSVANVPQEALDEFRSRLAMGFPGLLGLEAGEPLAVASGAEYSLAELISFREAVRDQVVAEIDEVVAIRIDERENRVVVGATDLNRRAEIIRAAEEAGVPSTALAVERRGKGTLLKNLGDDFNPVPGGVEINDNCTLGVNVATIAGDTALITASHCTGSTFTLDSVGIGQAGTTPVIATDEIDDTEHRTSCPGSITSCASVDAALIKYDNFSDAEFAKIAKTGLGSTTVTGRLTLTGKSSVMEDDTVRFTGRTSGTKELRVWDTCDDRKYDYGSPFNDVWILCNMVFRGVANPGDSGSPIYLPLSGDDVGMIGIVFAKDTIGDGFSAVVGSSFLQVESELGGPSVITNN